MYCERHDVSITTAMGGAATGYTGVVTGQILQIRYVPHATTPLDAATDCTISGEISGLVLFTTADLGLSAFTAAVRQASHTTGGVAALYAAGGAAVLAPIAVAGERLKVLIANGADAKSGTFYVWVG